MGLWLVLLCFLISTGAAQALPRVFALDPAILNQTKTRIAKQDKALMPALARLRREAEQAMCEGLFTVTSKQHVPPSGDTHDYFKLVPYWWPEPTKPDGLPYIRRDGELNPENKHGTEVSCCGQVAGAAFSALLDKVPLENTAERFVLLYGDGRAAQTNNAEYPPQRPLIFLSPIFLSGVSLSPICPHDNSDGAPQKNVTPPNKSRRPVIFSGWVRQEVTEASRNSEAGSHRGRTTSHPVVFRRPDGRHF